MRTRLWLDPPQPRSTREKVLLGWTTACVWARETTQAPRALVVTAEVEELQFLIDLPYKQLLCSAQNYNSGIAVPEGINPYGHELSDVT
ncbi:hypothetical protein llap_12750 [Limosa lapponica baueri]|uniref:Uncharacterized protein n=1 Tax=Limosa lapponica baueri TaxID=1758121 RepID=A0A2I0TT09_LIMLA|nr:hypothetical protein llap_12750 [Limosa lapponica baueri]